MKDNKWVRKLSVTVVKDNKWVRKLSVTVVKDNKWVQKLSATVVKDNKWVRKLSATTVTDNNADRLVAHQSEWPVYSNKMGTAHYGRSPFDSCFTHDHLLGYIWFQMREATLQTENVCSRRGTGVIEDRVTSLIFRQTLFSFLFSYFLPFRVLRCYGWVY